ncbi:YbhB/YbcL family Raf kinase inhibitor-like protein [Halosimplex litoreum]|uniref:YbhB/YbcL family Raf kinase inhibitor-like protein n=1 Tax=Halosimplex litoreum TaxID=1198301 RepID=A0A7T3FZ14_9EURY|nr:YbhB/YbcL family Raf kinase inhibitor-like protein [Halosimplex litoreum]QPV63350.1 YbhB/YbcL family Raf kinase inhibitor-like protein [Halosimplex litoreum]
MRRRDVLATVAGATAVGVAGCAGSEAETETPRAFRVSSPAIDPDEQLPARFTCTGEGVSPPFVVERTPEPTAAVAVTASFNQGPITDRTFWTLWNVPPDRTRIPAALPGEAVVESLGGARQGRPEGGDPGYLSPCPPRGEPFTYRFQVYALSERLSVEGGATHDTASEAIGNAVLASRRFSVEYTRPSSDPDAQAESND